MNLSKPLLTTVIAALCGCGSDTSTDQEEVFLSEYYAGNNGDIFSFERISTATYSVAEIGTVSNTKSIIHTFSEVQTIPEKYNYSYSNNGPFILESQTEDNELDHLTYSEISGNSIISDDLSQFTSSEYETSFGSEEPTEIKIGDSFSHQATSREFNSNTSEDVGYSTLSLELQVLSVEDILVPAGNFHSVKLGYTSEVINAHEMDANFELSGYMWFESESGHMLKMTTINTFVIQSSKYGEVTGESSSTLQATDINIVDAKKIESRSLSKSITPSLKLANLSTIPSILLKATSEPSKEVNYDL